MKKVTIKKVLEVIDGIEAKNLKDFKSLLVERINELENATSSRSSNPPKEIDGVVHYFCRYHQQYEPEHNMVMSGGKSKGYCKAGNKVWQSMYSQIKKLKVRIAELYVADKAKEAAVLSENVRKLELDLNSVNSYNYELDWGNYNAGK